MRISLSSTRYILPYYNSDAGIISRCEYDVHEIALLLPNIAAMSQEKLTAALLSILDIQTCELR